jgi:poly-gamma-glutamate synthesis protein (capsule biosynthesis protein)
MIDGLKRNITLCVVLISVSAGCSGNTADRDEPREVRIALVGQALSRYDPREFLENPAATVVPYLRAADVAFTNLEVAIDGEYCPCPPTKEGNSLQVAKPSVVEFLSGLNFGLMALSNNHSWNYSAEGIRSTIKAARDVGVTPAGTGENLVEASAAGLRGVAGYRVALIANATVNLGPEAAAGDAKPGVNFVRLGNQSDWVRNVTSIREARDTADIVLVYQHYQVDEDDIAPGNRFGHHQVEDLDEWQRSWARAVIDAGASLYVAHGSREFKGVEVYNGRPIFYGLGNFIFHSGREIGRYSHEVWESVIATVTFADAEPVSIEFVPIVLDEGTPGEYFLQRRGVPEVAEGELAGSILWRLAALSAEYGTTIQVTGAKASLELR